MSRLILQVYGRACEILVLIAYYAKMLPKFANADKKSKLWFERLSTSILVNACLSLRCSKCDKYQNHGSSWAYTEGAGGPDPHPRKKSQKYRIS